MSESACAENTDLGKSLVRLPRILPYCSRRVTVAFVYAPRCFGNRIFFLDRPTQALRIVSLTLASGISLPLI